MNHEIFQVPPEPVEPSVEGELTIFAQNLYSEKRGSVEFVAPNYGAKLFMEDEAGEIKPSGLPKPSSEKSSVPFPPPETQEGAAEILPEKEKIIPTRLTKGKPEPEQIKTAREAWERLAGGNPLTEEEKTFVEKGILPFGGGADRFSSVDLKLTDMDLIRVAGRLNALSEDEFFEPNNLEKSEEEIKKLIGERKVTEDQARRVLERLNYWMFEAATRKVGGRERREQREQLRSELYFGFTDEDVEFFEKIRELPEDEAERLIRIRFEEHVGELEKIPTRQFYESANELIIRKLNALVNLWRSRNPEKGRGLFEEIQIRFVVHELNRILVTEPGDLKKYAGAAHLLHMSYINTIDRISGVASAQRFFELAAARQLRNKKGIFTNEDVEQMSNWVRGRLKEIEMPKIERELKGRLKRDPSEEEKEEAWSLEGEKGVNLGGKMFTIMQRLSYFVAQSRLPREKDKTTGREMVIAPSAIKRFPGEMFAVIYNPTEILWERYQIGSHAGARFRDLTGPITPKMADFYSSGWRDDEFIRQLNEIDPEENLGLWMRFRIEGKSSTKRNILEKIIKSQPMSFLHAYRALINRGEVEKFVAEHGDKLGELEEILAVEGEKSLKRKDLPNLDQVKRNHTEHADLINKLIEFANDRKENFLAYRTPPGEQARSMILMDIPWEELDHTRLQEDAYKRLVEGDNIVASEAVSFLTAINTDPRDLSRTMKLRDSISKYDSLGEEQDMIGVVLEGQFRYLKKAKWANFLPELPEWTRVLLKKIKITISDSQLYQGVTSPALSPQTIRNRMNDFTASGLIGDKQVEKLEKDIGVQAWKTTLIEEYRSLPAYLQAFLKPFIEYFLGVKL